MTQNGPHFIQFFLGLQNEKEVCNCNCKTKQNKTNKMGKEEEKQFQYTLIIIIILTNLNAVGYFTTFHSREKVYAIGQGREEKQT
jgi:hypothetical protein